MVEKEILNLIASNAPGLIFSNAYRRQEMIAQIYSYRKVEILDACQEVVNNPNVKLKEIYNLSSELKFIQELKQLEDKVDWFDEKLYIARIIFVLCITILIVFHFYPIASSKIQLFIVIAALSIMILTIIFYSVFLNLNGRIEKIYRKLSTEDSSVWEDKEKLIEIIGTPNPLK